MLSRARAVTGLTIVVGVLAFLWLEFVLNFDFHWYTVQDHVFGKFGLPHDFQLVLPASFIGWGLYFALGAGTAGVYKTAIASVVGTGAAAILMAFGPAAAGAPDFWGLALWAGITGMGIMLLSTVRDDDLLSPAPAFVCYGAAFAWWLTTGLDKFVSDGKGPHTVAAVTLALTSKPLAAGTGAFAGLVSLPWPWVALDVCVSIICGALLGLLTVALTGSLDRILGARPGATQTAPTVADDIVTT